MQTATAPPARRKKRRTRTDAAVAASQPTGATIKGHLPLLGLAAASLLLQSLIFAPIGLWPVAFICLTPWLVMVGASQFAPRVYAYSFLMAVAFFLVNMRWMIPATVEGYAALSVYQAIYFPLLACAIRHVIRRRGWPLGLAFPAIWVAGELLRGVVLSGFPWFFLSHSLAGVLPLIQISDLVGAYGVSFVIAAVNGALADLVLARLKPPAEAGWGPPPVSYSRRPRLSIAAAVIPLTAALAYGAFQLSRDTTKPGPKVAILQGDFVMTVDGEEVNDPDKRRIYFEMLDAAAAEEPEIYVLPETPWIMYLNPEVRDFYEVSRHSFARLQQHAREHQAHIITGSASLERTPHDLLAAERRFNSAAVFWPDGSEPGRYDKVHLVYFGEMIPFRFGRLRFLYLWFNRMMPFSNGGADEYSIFPGEKFDTFATKPTASKDQAYRFGIPICYEDVMPYVARRFVSAGRPEKQADFLFNISNDGWFGRGIQQPQHLAICVFRAVENRVGIARAVNTGVSAFIDPSGKVRNRVSGDPSGRWPKECGYQVANISVDSRYSLYSRYGDWFAWSCAAVLLLLLVDYWIARARAYGDD